MGGAAVKGAAPPIADAEGRGDLRAVEEEVPGRREEDELMEVKGAPVVMLVVMETWLFSD